MRRLPYFLAAVVLTACYTAQPAPPEPHKFGAVRAAPATEGTLADMQSNFVFANQNDAGTYAVKAASGFLHNVCVNTIVATATIQLQDGDAGTPIGVITLPAAGAGDMPECLPYDVAFANGLVVVTSGLTNVTESYR